MHILLLYTLLLSADRYWLSNKLLIPKNSKDILNISIRSRDIIYNEYYLRLA